MKKIILLFLKVYQKFLTLFGYGCCRYYPTCSEYAKWQFQNNSFLKAIFFSILRVLKCNQLFKGGIDYPVIKKKLNKKRVCLTDKSRREITIKFWLVSKNQNSFYIIKNFYKDQNDR